jgi:hypothetical protein
MNTRNTALAARTLALAAAGTLASSAGAGVVYQQDFENAANIGAEWSSSATEESFPFTRFSQRRTNDTLSLTLNTTNGQAYSLVFDLYTIDSWGGANPVWGYDRFNVNIEGETLFSELIDNQPGSPNADFRAPEVIGHLGFGMRPVDRDAIYRDIVLDFVATGDSTTFAFFGSGLQDLRDESWGIDNVRVAAVPAPAGVAALSAGALFALRRRRAPLSR